MQTLRSIRTSLLAASAQEEARSAALDSLLFLLDQQRQQHWNDPTLLRSALKLLSDAAVRHPSFVIPRATQTLRALLLASRERISATAVAVLASIAEAADPEGQALACSVLADEDLVLTLASSRAVSVRARFAELLLFLLVNGQGAPVPVSPGLLLTLFLGLSNDIYPRVRRVALDGLVALCKISTAETRGRMLKECVYDRALPFLRDEEPDVKSAAIRLVTEWGKMLAESHMLYGLDVRGISDAIFIQICAVARDMEMTIRVEAFNALGDVKLVSEHLLLQSLSKKVLSSHDEECNLSEYSMHLIKESKCLLASAAGAFIQGLEDEYCEVREAACISMGRLAAFSAKFSDGALNLLIDILNDDKHGVKLRALQVFLDMATNVHLNIQEIHMHMFLSMLVETSSSIRNAARKVLSTVTLPELDMFKSSIESLFTNLDMYPEDEKDIFAILYLIGRNHRKFATAFIQKRMKETALNFGGDMLPDSPQAVALIILAISVTFSYQDSTCSISREVFCHALLFLGRISSSLQGVISREQLLAYLSNQSGIPYIPLDSHSVEKGKLTDSASENVLSHPVSKQLSRHESHLDEEGLSMGFWTSNCSNHQRQMINRASVYVDEQMVESEQQMLTEKHQEENANNKIAIDSANLVMKTAVQLWNSIQCQHIHQIQQTLRSFDEELEWIAMDVDYSVKAYVIFVKEYVQVIALAIQIWGHIVPSKVHTSGMEKLDVLLDRLDHVLRRLRYAFVDLQSEAEANVLELILYGCVARTYKLGFLPRPMLTRVHAVISQLEHLEKSSSESSDFVQKVKSIYLKPSNIDLQNPTFLCGLLRLFSLKQIQFTGKLRHVRAELHSPGNDSENPDPFIPGLPAGIKLQVNLYNIFDNNRVWVQFSAGSMIQHVYLDMAQFEDSDEARSFLSSFSFYGAPQVPAFVLEVVVLMECSVENERRGGDHKKGPQCKTVPLCDALNIYLINAKNY